MSTVDARLALASLAEHISRYRFSAANEKLLQLQLANVFRACGLPFRAEVTLGQGDRIDFVVGDARPLIGIELKIEGGLSEVTRQVHRYLQHPELDAVLVVATVMRLGGLPSEMNGKPVQVLTLIGSML